jgi:predicted PurR-regulated permease PerM
VTEPVAAAPADTPAGASIESAPPWLLPVIRHTLWRVIWTGLGMTIVVLCLLRARGLVSTLVIAAFLSIAMDPAVTALNAKRGWKRGAATGLVFLVVVTSVIVLVAVLIPALVQVAEQISGRIPGWINSINATFHVSIGGNTTRSAEDLQAAARGWLEDHGQAVLGIASTGVGVVFQFLTTAMFTFYFAADAPKIRRALLVRLPPQRQARIGWAWDTAIQQTGGYFFSRLVLLVINAGLFFFVMVAVGTPWLVALPLAVFQGFFAEFIPVVGTYVGAAVPAVVVLGFQGVWQAAVLVGWTLLYQQLENYWLGPRLSARTMDINGGVAFGSALAGGAVGGPLGAFMAMPVAALITSFVKHYGQRYPLVYQSEFDPELGSAAPMSDTLADVESPASP